MDPNNTFKKSDWIAQGKLWASVPPSLKKIVAQWFLIPQVLEHDILPSPFLSIAALLEFPLPLESTVPATQPAQYFSKAVPDITDADLILRVRRLPIPDKKTVDKLLACSRQCWLDGYQSVIYSHLGGAVTHFPLWILTYWKEVHDIKRDAWGPWKTCQAWVKRQSKLSKKNPERAALAAETSLMLAMVPWGRCKPPGLSDSEPFHTLWRFVGPHWLSGSQMDDMLELLRYKVNTSPEAMKNTRIWGTALIPKILAAYRAADTGTYRSDPSLRWIRELAEDVVHSQAALITSGHLGDITDEPHWVAVIFDMSQPAGVVRYGDSFGGEIPEELADACRWWLNQHISADIGLVDLPIAHQEDGFSCSMLVDNAQQHFVDPSIPLADPAQFANARLEVFNKICVRSLEQLEIEKALAIAEDEDSDDQSDFGNTATTSAGHVDDSDSDSDTPIPLLRRTARGAKFTFTSPISIASSPARDSPARVVGTKRPKGHPDAPTPNPSPQKHRDFIRRGDSNIPAPPQPAFGPPPRSSSPRSTADVFGPRSRSAKDDGYGTDSESEGAGDDAAADEYSWGSDDDAPVPPESQMNTAADDPLEAADDSLEDHPTTYDCTDDELPDLHTPSCSEDEDDDDDESGPDSDPMPDLEEVDVTDDEAMLAHTHRVHAARQTAQPTPPRPKPVPAAKAKLTAYFTVETPEEKAARREKEAAVYAERAEQTRLREVEERRKKLARDRQRANERMQRHRDRRREERMKEGWIPGQKRKRVELADYDEVTTPDALLPESSRPRRQFKEDDRAGNKPCGRKRKEKNKKRNAKYTNWFHPILFSQVQAAASRVSKPWKPRAILKELQKTNPKDFYRLTEQVIGRWIDGDARDRGTSKWKESVIKNVERGKGNAPGGHTTRCGVLHPYPATRKKINDHLTSLRGAGVVLTLLSIRGIMVSHIQHDAPDLFTQTRNDGTQFRCSESFARRYLRNTLGWSERRSTKAAQKLPANYEKILEEAFFREAHIIRDYAIPAALRVNTDQTQIVYQQGTGSTWTQRGAKQVATVGQEEKRAFTLVPSISGSGKLLNMQGVFQGKTTVSCPSPSAARYDEATALGYCMVSSGTSTYWSNHSTMHHLVDHIVAPYFDAVKVELHLPPSQVSLWSIDCWSVHKSKEFRAWMKKNHPTIILLFVPGGCTSVWQPLDVGIQRLLKLSIKRSAHRDVVEEALGQIKADKATHDIRLDTTVGTLRDRSVGWIVQAINDLNDPAVITQAFEMCRVGNFNRSQASLTSPEALAGLRELRTTNPTLHAALNQATEADVIQVGPDDIEEEEYGSDSYAYDDCDVPLDVLSGHLLSGGASVADNFVVDTDGGIARSGRAEASDAEESDDEPVVLGRGQRKKTAARRYMGPAWEQH